MQTQKFTLNSEQKMSTEEQSNRPRGGNTTEEIEMHTNTSIDTMTAAPMVRIHPRRASMQRPSVDELLARARVEHEDSYWLFDERSNLHIPGAAEVALVSELVRRAPNDFLAGYVSGLFVNN